jgi:hypothetical protein
MVSLREPVRDWLKQVFGAQTLNEMKAVAEREGERVFGTQYTIQDYEDDLTHHEQKMKEAEDRFEHFNDLRNDYLEQARSASNLTRKRYLAKARKMRKQAFKHVKLFVAHLEKFEQKLDELTAYETKAVSADENTKVDLDETAEAVNEQLIGNTSEMDSVEREEADKAIERELNKHSLDDKVRREEEALRQMEEEGVSAEEVGLNEDVDGFLEEELGGEAPSTDGEEEDQVELEW